MFTSLLLVGPKQTGKTSLMVEMAQYLARTIPTLKIRFLPTEFTIYPEVAVIGEKGGAAIRIVSVGGGRSDDIIAYRTAMMAREAAEVPNTLLVLVIDNKFVKVNGSQVIIDLGENEELERVLAEVKNEFVRDPKRPGFRELIVVLNKVDLLEEELRKKGLELKKLEPKIVRALTEYVAKKLGISRRRILRVLFSYAKRGGEEKRLLVERMSASRIVEMEGGEFKKAKEEFREEVEKRVSERHREYTFNTLYWILKALATVAPPNISPRLMKAMEAVRKDFEKFVRDYVWGEGVASRSSAGSSSLST